MFHCYETPDIGPTKRERRELEKKKREAPSRDKGEPKPPPPNREPRGAPCH